MKRIHQLDEISAQRIRSHAHFDGIPAILQVLIQNSICAGANKVTVKIDLNSLSVCIEDNGKGIERNKLLAIADCVLYNGHLKPTRYSSGYIVQEKEENESKKMGDLAPYLYSSGWILNCGPSYSERDPSAMAASVERTQCKRDLASESYSGDCSEREVNSTEAQMQRIKEAQTHSGELPNRYDCKAALLPVGYKGTSTRTILGLCSNFVLASANHNEPAAAAFSSSNPSLVDVLTDFFKVRIPSKGTMVILSRLFAHMPVRSKYVKGNLTKGKLERDLKRMVFIEMVANPSLDVRVGFMEQKQVEWIFSSTDSSLQSLFLTFFDGLNSKTFSHGLDSAGFAFEGAMCVSDQGMQLVFLNGVHVALSQKQNASLWTIFKTSLGAKQVSYFISISESYTDDISCIWETVLQTVQDILSYRSNPSPKKKKTPLVPSVEQSSKYFSGDISIDERDIEESRLKIISQVQSSFILASSGLKLLAIDPHACDERVRLEVLLEEFVDMVANPAVDLRIALDDPLEFSVTEKDVGYFQKYHANFIAFGIDYHFQSNALSVTHLNHYLQKTSAIHLKQHMLHHFSHKKNSSQHIQAASNWVLSIRSIPAYIFDAIASRACRQSVKFGQNLTTQEMHHIIDSLRKCRLPFQCAHGRPTILPLCNEKMEVFDLDQVT